LPPLKPFGQQAHYQAGLHAALATLGALWETRASGLGQQIDVSVQAAIASQLEIAMSHFLYGGRVASRLGSRLLGVWGIVQLADGLLFIVTVTEDEWQRLVAFLGSPDWAGSVLFADRLLRATNNDGLLALIESELAGRTVQETFAALQDVRVPCAPVSEMASLLNSPHLQARGAFSTTDHPLAGRWTYPGAPYKLSATPWQAGRPATALGAESAAVVSGVWSPRARREPAAQRDLPLAGLRVADFTWVWAGPLATMQLAHLGADVIRVESSTRPDTVRGIPPFWEEKTGPNRSGYFNQYNQGKRSILLNLKTPEGLELAHDLVRRADVVADNFSGGAMARLGLGYDALRQIKPDIIQISMSGLGQDGPFSRYVAYGPTQVPTIGLASLTGYPGGGPREAGLSYGDPNAGLNAAIAILAALHHRARTGEGQYIDMSQWEAAVPLVAEGLLTYEMTGEQPPRMGNRDQWEAPQGVFRCAGNDEWLALSCWSDAEWQALAAAIGRADLAADPALATRAGRKAREPELEQAIAAWTLAQQRDTAAATLRGAGVPAQAVLTTEDVANDSALAERGFWTQLDHPETPGARYAGIPWRFSTTPLHVRRAAPCVGEHTDEVLREVLGRDDAIEADEDDAFQPGRFAVVDDQAAQTGR
jgi:benzylsuccinate CoA-transferase BbsF subunit